MRHLCIAMLLLAGCSTQPAPKSSPGYSFVTGVQIVSYDVIQAVVPNAMLTEIASALPYTQDQSAVGGFFAPRPAASPSSCVAPDWYVLAGVVGPLAYVPLTACAEIPGTVVAVEEPRQPSWTWWHDTWYLVPDQPGLTNMFSVNEPKSWATATSNSLKVEQPQGFAMPAIGQHVVAKGVFDVNLDWGMTEITNGEGRAW